MKICSATTEFARRRSSGFARAMSVLVPGAGVGRATWSMSLIARIDHVVDERDAGSDVRADQVAGRQLAGRVLAGHRLVPPHPARADAPAGELLGVVLRRHRQRICPVRSSSHVLMPVSGGEPLRIVSIVAISLR